MHSSKLFVNRQQIVLVTGAGGFIGGRITEVLHCAGLCTVRAALRSWSSADRIGRMPCDIVLCYITDQDQVNESLDGVHSVIHCAHGGPAVNIDGTKNLLEASLRRGVSRFVHISTMAVYGDTPGVIDESTPIQYTRSEYGDTKIEGEKLCNEYQQQGLPVTILRPGIVYGPFSESWTVEPATRLKSRRWHVPEEYASGTCNLIYIDDLVSLVLLALTRPTAPGQTFNANGSDRLTWYDYFSLLNSELALPSLAHVGRLRARGNAAMLAPVRSTARFLLKHFQVPIMRLYQQSAIAKHAMRHIENTIRTTSSSAEFELYSRDQFLDTRKAQRLLGHTPAFSSDEGVAQSVAWLRHLRIV